MGVAGGDVGGDGGAEVRAGDFQDRDFLIETVDVELLVELGQAAVGEIDDDKAEVVAHADYAAIEDVCGTGDWLVPAFIRFHENRFGDAICIGRLSRGSVVRLRAFASRSAKDKNDTGDREQILHRAGLNTRLWGGTSIGKTAG